MNATIGTVKTAETMFCTRCGSPYRPAWDKFCAGCGMSLMGGFSYPTRGSEMKGRRRTDYALMIVSTVCSGLFILPVLLTWIIWHFTADKITKIVIHGLRSRSKLLRPRSVKQVFLIDESLTSKNDVRFILRKSLLPFALVIGISGTLGRVLSNYQWPASPPLNPVFNSVVTTVIIGIIVWPLLSVFVVPVTWVLDILGVRFLNEKRRTIEPFRISSFWQNLISFGTIISFLYYLSTTPSTRGGGTPDPVMNLLAFIAIVIFLFPPAILLTTLYYNYSFPKHLSSAYQSFEKKGVSLVEWRELGK